MTSISIFEDVFLRPLGLVKIISDVSDHLATCYAQTGLAAFLLYAIQITYELLERDFQQCHTYIVVYINRQFWTGVQAE